MIPRVDRLGPTDRHLAAVLASARSGGAVCDSDRLRLAVEFAAHEHGPDDAGHLVGQRDRRDLFQLACQQLQKPGRGGAAHSLRLIIVTGRLLLVVVANHRSLAQLMPSGVVHPNTAEELSRKSSRMTALPRRSSSRARKARPNWRSGKRRSLAGAMSSAATRRKPKRTPRRAPNSSPASSASSPRATRRWSPTRASAVF